MINRHLLWRSLWAVTVMVTTPGLANTLTANADIALSFPQSPRLSDAVLTITQTQQRSLDDIYWPAAGLYRLETKRAKGIRDLQPIREQISGNTGEQRQRWQALYHSLNKMAVGERVSVPVDPDITRITPNKNPKLNGNWHLQLPKRPQHVMVLGNVSQPGSYPWHERLSAKSYLQQAEPGSWHDSTVWVVSPSGERAQYPIAYWNGQHRDILPGSVIYRPLNYKPTKDQIIDPNQHVLTYLQNRFIE
ncbi:hypothetical protein BGL48_15745 [Salinivibrio sp. SS3]|uniref:capsule biosynthesis GfcC family protein n=1 Tax=Salinivibrio TaxID=51366 RepID=UPI000847DC70|nr:MULTISPECIES: capsule biosynthesis GfcC family protein [Salinivibrio]ODP96837.1 hypothetical protein BGL48_15745 [Salinivibrio sp. BNH]WBA10872.1 capsule biosynthesis GfcC family protein [Salinivibrio kushneri]